MDTNGNFDFRSIRELPRFSALNTMKLPSGANASLHHSSSISSTSSSDSGSSGKVEAPFRNWMIEDTSNSGSDARVHPAEVEELEDEDEPDSPLPSPSSLPFFPRRRRESRRDRRARTTFTSQQTQVLEHEYRRSEYISRPRRYELATQLNLKEVQIKIWYQNRRAKDKRIEKAHWDRQYRCLDLAAVVAVASQFPKAANYRLQAGFNARLQHPLHMYPSSSTASFPIPFLPRFPTALAGCSRSTPEPPGKYASGSKSD